MKFTSSRSNCPIGMTLDVVGDRWTLLVLRGMIFGNSTTFKELSEYPEKIASNILTERLQRLEAEEIIRKVPDATDGRKSIYKVTEKGLDLMPVLLEMINWGMKYNPDAQYPKAIVDSAASNKDSLIQHARLEALAI